MLVKEGHLESSAVAKHAYERHHPVKQEEADALVHARGYNELKGGFP